MRPATRPREEPLDERLLVLDPGSGRLEDRRVRDLPDVLRPGDLLVVNDAATLPASLHGATSAGEPIEARLAGPGDSDGAWTAVLFGRGDWRTRTEDRPAPPAVRPGDVLLFGGELTGNVRRVSPVSPRLVELVFEPGGDAFWGALYRSAKPVQYSHLESPLALWDVQTSYGARPWAVEAPSAGRPLRWELLGALGERGVALASVTHAAGLSSTGDPAVDSLLPFPERFDVPRATVEAVRDTRAKGGRVVAVGTSVVRALEGSASANGGELRSGAGVTDLRVGKGSRLRVADGLLTGLHEPGTSHFDMLKAFAPDVLLATAYRHVEAAGYLGHEFGDAMLIVGEERRGLSA